MSSRLYVKLALYSTHVSGAHVCIYMQNGFFCVFREAELSLLGILLWSFSQVFYIVPLSLEEMPNPRFYLEYFLCGQALFSPPVQPFESFSALQTASTTEAEAARQATKLSISVSPLAFRRAAPASGQLLQENKVPKMPAAPFSRAVAQAGRQAGQQPEASRQNSTATLRNAGSSDQWIHNSRPSRYGVISQYYPTVIYNICLVPLSTACVSLWGDSIIHIYNSTMKAIISCPVSLFI